MLLGLWFDIDHHGGIAAHEFFTEDATLTFDAKTLHGRAEIEDVYRQRRERGGRFSRHVQTNLHATTLTPERVECSSVLLLFAADGEPPLPSTAPSAIGDVNDVVVRFGNEWRIASRRITHVFIDPSTTLAIPRS